MHQMRVAVEFPRNLELEMLWGKYSDVFRQDRQGARAELSREMHLLFE
jgi:hypothetical protein